MQGGKGSERPGGNVVSLRAARKDMQRRSARKAAASNRLAHGRTKAARDLERAQDDKRSRDLDGHKIDRREGQ